MDTGGEITLTMMMSLACPELSDWESVLLSFIHLV
jgi:hypothetical protein